MLMTNCNRRRENNQTQNGGNGKNAEFVKDKK